MILSIVSGQRRKVQPMTSESLLTPDSSEPELPKLFNLIPVGFCCLLDFFFIRPSGRFNRTVRDAARAETFAWDVNGREF